MIIPIKTNKEKYFRQLLEILRPIKPFNSISKREREVLAFLLYSNYIAKDLPKEDRFMYVFSEGVKEEIRLKYSISKNSLNNYLTILRKKGFITYNSICKPFEIMPDKTITFKFEEEKHNDDN